MLSEHANKIIKDIDKVRKKRMNIDYLLQKYHEKPERDFIQKYAETKIANVGVIAYWATVSLAFLSFMVTITFFFYENEIKGYKSVYDGIIIIFCLGYLFASYNLYIAYKGNIFEKIIIEIKDINMQSNIETKPTIISKLDQLSNFCKKLIKLI